MKGLLFGMAVAVILTMPLSAPNYAKSHGNLHQYTGPANRDCQSIANVTRGAHRSGGAGAASWGACLPHPSERRMRSDHQVRIGGGHFALPGEKHGFLAEEGVHAGDMPNQVVGPDGVLRIHVLDPNGTLETGEGSLFGADGSSSSFTPRLMITEVSRQATLGIASPARLSSNSARIPR
jgi:hypothetical protein